LYMVRVRYADASEIASKLTEILGGQGAAAQPAQDPRRRRAQQQQQQRRRAQEVTEAAEGADSIASAVPSQIVADERTNSLILLASEPAYLRVKALVERLDVQIDVEGAGRINVYRLEHADAEEMAQTLDNVISGMQQRSGQASGDARQRAARQRAATDEESAPAFEGEVRVTHDAPTNSLVILASVKDFRALRDGVIRRLDVRRPQVYIEAKIVEISVDTSRDLGTSWHGGHAVGDGHILLGGAQHSDLRSVNPAGSLLSLSGLLGGIIGTPLEGAEEILFGQSIPSFGVLFQALATSSNVNLLSSPHILTLDNEEAELLVGENIPYIAGSFGTPFGGGQQQQQQLGSLFPGTNIQRQDVALELKLTPQISAANEVRLNIDLEISNIASRDFEGLGPSWARRTIKDTVIVPDQQTIVIGGLMRDQITSSESKVPLLGDIPLLGYLFKYTTQSKSKTNLLVLLTPYIVNDHMDIERIVERRVREQREFMRAHSAFSHVQYRPDIDYSRKRGLLAEISRTLDHVQEERERLERFEVGRVEFESGPVEYRTRAEPDDLEEDALDDDFEVLVEGEGDDASGEGE
jgi:general secretion pathway protein D